MAKRRGKTGRVSYEGEQYRGGRGAGKKNLRRVDGGYQNKYGVTFTEQQKKDLERSVNRSNYKRKKQIAEVDELNPRNKDLRTMGQESDFIISRQSKSLQQFKSMEDYERYMDKQARIQSGEYLEDATRLYKKNYMKALENAFGDEAKGMQMKVRMMKPEDFRKLVESNEDLEIGFIYSPDALDAKKAQIRKALKMKDEDYFSPV